MIKNKKITAIVLAGGKGNRMGGETPKQYLMLENKPLIYYALKTFEESIVDEIVLVVGKGEQEYCKKNIIDEYKIQKVSKIVEGGKERYNSVYNGLKEIDATGIVLVHDGARAFVTTDIIKRSAEGALKYHACVVGMKVKDTIKIANEHNYIEETPDRNYLWQVQTPQAFLYPEILDAYINVLNGEKHNITDDAMIWELYSDIPVKLIEGSYTNIKITTPEDMEYGKVILKLEKNKK